MRLALALAAVVVACARQDYSCREDVCFYHVPKTGGDSFKYLLRDELKRRGRSFWSNEWCPTRSKGKEPDAVETLFVGALGLAHDLAALYEV